MCHIKSISGPGHPSSQNWTLDFEPAFSPRFCFLLSPRSLFPTAQRFPIRKHVTSGLGVTSGHVISGHFRFRSCDFRFRLWRHPYIKTRLILPSGPTLLLVYAKPVDSVFHALWLATQTRDSICYSPLGIFLDFARQFSLISQKKGTLFGAGYPLVWYILKQLLTSVSVKSDRYLPRSFAARQICTTFHLHFGD